MIFGKLSPIHGDTVTYTCLRKWRQPQAGEVIIVLQGDVLTVGGTAIIELLPSGFVRKLPLPNPYCLREEKDHRSNMSTEHEAYKLLGDHSCVPELVSWDPADYSLTMEYMQNGSLMEYVQQHKRNISLRLRLQWSKQAAKAICTVHSAGVIHCDIHPRNFLLNSNLDLKISDFGGASVHGSEPSATAATRFLSPDHDWNAKPTRVDDIFSLGSLMYFIFTDVYPFTDESSDEVRRSFKSDDFPNVSWLLCGDVILQCWQRKVNTAQTVFDRLSQLNTETW